MLAGCTLIALALIDVALACAWLGVHVRRDDRSDARVRQFVCDQTIARMQTRHGSGT